jgi:hypothetical protein
MQDNRTPRQKREDDALDILDKDPFNPETEMEDTLEFWRGNGGAANFSIVSKIQGPPGRREGQVVRLTRSVGDVAEGSIRVILYYIAGTPDPPVGADSPPEHPYPPECQVLFCDAWDKDGTLSYSEMTEADCLEPYTETPPWVPFAVDERGYPVERAQVEETPGGGGEAAVQAGVRRVTQEEGKGGAASARPRRRGEGCDRGVQR